MTVFLRALYGPFGPFHEPHHIDWFFFGIREDNTVGRWAVRFHIRTRTWQSVAYPVDATIDIGGKLVSGREAVNKDAFVPDRPMVRAPTYLDLLKPYLSAADIAVASRAAIEVAR